MDDAYTGPENDNVLEQLLTLIIEMPMEKRLNLLNRLEDAAFEEETDLKREDVRKVYNKEISFDFENYTHIGTIIDISTSGVFIETESEFKIGQMIVMNIPETNGDGYVRLAGEIVRTQPGGIGVKFMPKAKS